MAQFTPDANRAESQITVTAAGNTQTFPYPAGTAASSFGADGFHYITSRDFSRLDARLRHIEITFGANNITVRNMTERSFKVGQVLHLQLEIAGYDGSGDDVPAGVAKMVLAMVDLGTPATADANGAVESQAATVASGLATGFNGALVSDGVAVFDVPRNVVASWTGTAILTVTGTDVNGNTVVESSASGTSMTGAKAFKTVTGVSVSANVTALTVGSGQVLGLPVFLQDALDVEQERQDGVAATAGTIVTGDEAVATATTGDVRGTYTPNSAPNGSRQYELRCALRSASFRGREQYAG